MDITADITTTATVMPGSNVRGTFETDSDRDWYKIDLQAGFTYNFALDRDGADSASNGRVRVFDVEGEEVTDPWKATNFFPGIFDRYNFTPETAGTYYIEVETKFGGGGAGDYTLRASGPLSDDIPGGITTTETVAIGEKRRFDLDYNGDLDLFGVILTAGTEYLIRVGGDTENTHEPIALLYDNSGNPIFVGLAGNNKDGVIRFTPETSGTYFVGGAVEDRNTDMLTPSNAFVQVDIAASFDEIPGNNFFGPDDISDAKAISIGDTVLSSLDYRGDSDWFAVDLAAGDEIIAYVGKFGIAYASSIEIEVQGPFGSGRSPITTTEEKNGDFELVRFTATETGTYYFDVHNPSGGGTRDRFGTYTFSVQNASLDPEAGDETSSISVAVGSEYSGTIGMPGDFDWIGMNLTAGNSYLIELSGDRGLNLGSDIGQIIVTDTGNFTPSGEVETLQNGNVVFTPSSTGTYFAVVDGSAQITGSYTLSLELFTQPDDTLGNTTTDSVLTSGRSVFDNIEVVGDADWHAMDLVAGTRYTIGVAGETFGLGQKLDIRDASGAIIASSSSGIDIGTSRDFTPDKTGRYFVSVDYEGDTGQYTVGFVKASLDVEGEKVATARAITPGTPQAAKIDVPGDVDLFKFEAVAGHTYVLQTSGEKTINIESVSHISSDIGLEFDVIGISTAGAKVFTAEKTGTHIIEILGSMTGRDFADSNLGDYTLSLSVGASDAIARDSRTSVTVDDSAPLVSQINFDGDIDAVWVSLEKGKAYRFTVEGEGADALLDPTIELIGPDGSRVKLDADSGVGWDALIEHFAEVKGEYLVRIKGAASDTGSYRLLMEERPVPSLVSSVLTTTQIQDPSDISIFFDTGTKSKGWTSGERTAVFDVLDVIENAIDVTFSITTSKSDADWVLRTKTNLPGSAAANFQYPGDQQIGNFARKDIFDWDTAGFGPGTFAFGVLLHEFGHGLGLAHPHENDRGSTTLLGVETPDDLGTFKLNQGVYSVMSYNEGHDSAGQSGTFMPIDLAALQSIYGANGTAGAGNDTYNLDGLNAFSAIWDTGGYDAIRYSGSQFINIDLRAATLRYEEGGGGRISSFGGEYGYVIAKGVVIEKAIGGDGDDTLTGNSANNVLVGRSGNDVIWGRNGDDKLYGGSGNDSLLGMKGNDILVGHRGDDVVWGHKGNDMLYGRSGNDRLKGMIGSDTLVGNKGNDVLSGGAGSDQFVFGANNGADVIKDFQDGIDIIKFSDGSITFASLTLSEKAWGTLIDYGSGSIALNNISESAIDSGDFLFS